MQTEKEFFYLNGFGFIGASGQGSQGFDNWALSSQLGSQPGATPLTEYDPEQNVTSLKRYLSNSTILFCSSAYQALKNLDLTELLNTDPQGIGIYSSTCSPHMESVFEFDLMAKHDGPYRVSPLQAPNTLQNVDSSHFALRTKITGPNCTVTSGAAGVIDALGLALMHLEDKMIHLAVIGCNDLRSKLQVAKNSALLGDGGLPLSNEVGMTLIVSRAERSGNQPGLPIRTLTSRLAPKGESLAEFLLARIRDHLAANEEKTTAWILAAGAGVLRKDLKKASGNLPPALYLEEHVGLMDSVGGAAGLALAYQYFRNMDNPLAKKLPQGLNRLIIACVDEAGYVALAEVRRGGSF